MPTLNEIKEQIKDYKHGYIFWTEKEIRKLPKILDADERVIAVTSGYMGKATWLLVLTQRRLIFMNCGMFFGLRLIQVPLDRVQALDSAFVIVFGSISVWDGASSYRIGMILKSSILPFVQAAEAAIQAYKKPIQHPFAPERHAPAAPDVATQIAKLAALKDSGYLTEEEFTAHKKKLLD